MKINKNFKFIKYLCNLSVLISTFMMCNPFLVYAITDSDVNAAVAQKGKAGVTGNLFIWFICALAFLKIAQKVESFMSSLGINSAHTGGNMSLMGLAGSVMAAGRAFGSKGMGGFSKGGGGGSSSSNASNAKFLQGGLAGSVGRKFNETMTNNAKTLASNEGGNPIGNAIFDNSMKNGGNLATKGIGEIAKGSIGKEGLITGKKASKALNSYFSNNNQSTNSSNPLNTSTVGASKSLNEVSNTGNKVDTSNSSTLSTSNSSILQNSNSPTVSQNNLSSNSGGSLNKIANSQVSLDKSQSHLNNGDGEQPQSGNILNTSSTSNTMLQNGASNSIVQNGENLSGSDSILNNTSHKNLNLNSDNSSPINNINNQISNSPQVSENVSSNLETSNTASYKVESGGSSQLNVVSNQLSNLDNHISTSSEHSIGSSNANDGANKNISSTENSIQSTNPIQNANTNPIPSSSGFTSDNGATGNNVNYGNANVSHINSNGTSSTMQNGNLESNMPNLSTESLSVPSYSDVEIGGGRIMGTETSESFPQGIKFGMYNTDQYMPPEKGEYSQVQSNDGANWYKQYETKAVEKTPFKAPDGKIGYNEKLVNKLPPTPKRKDRV